MLKNVMVLNKLMVPAPMFWENFSNINQIKPLFMRTCNCHPQLCNQPLRLTEEERQNPLLVIKEFFECYHLNDFRDIMWAWMVEVITSEGSISNEPLERSNHIHFYEKMELLVEACYIIRDQMQKELLKIEPVIQPTG